MSGTLTLLDLAGDVGLLLWGTHMVTTGVLRGYGSNFRRWVGRRLGNRISALMAGLAVTAVLQSSTATSLMATSFASSGVIGLAPGLCVMLGANVGTTLVVQVLSFNIGLLAPVLVLAGVILFKRAEGSQLKNLGRIGIGLGLMLLALNLLVRTMTPVEATPALRAVAQALINQPILAALSAAILTWLCHSSVAIVLLIVSMVKSGTIASAAALTMVIGTNFGATVPAFLEAGSPVARRLPLGNMLMRATGCVVALLLVPTIVAQLARLDPEPARIVVNFHTAFNVALALVFIGPVKSLAGLLMRILPEPAPSADRATPRYLDEVLLETASVALVNAEREALRMADMVEEMLKGALKVFRNEDRRRARTISRMDATLDRLGVAVRSYLAEISHEELNEEDSQRNQEIFTFTINFDYVGDLLASMMAEFSTSKIKRGQSFTPDEFAEIAAMHAAVQESLNLGLAVFMRGGELMARQLVQRKKLIWQMESAAAERYFHRLRESRTQNAETDDFYLRVLRDLKRVHSFIAALSYPILDRAGQLQDRLVELPAAEPHDAESEEPPATTAAAGQKS